MRKLWKFLSQPQLVFPVLPLIWLITAFPILPVWLRTLVSAPFLLLVPGYFLYRLIAGYQQSTSQWSTVTYSTGLSLIILMVTGFLVNEIGLLLGDRTPLQTAPLALTLALITACLGMGAARRHLGQSAHFIPTRSLGTILIGALAPVLAIGGAVSLNNGGSNIFAILALSLAACYFLYILWLKRPLEWLYPYALYIIGLTILLGTSLRGWNITGHDVMQEFQVFQLTSVHSAWHMHFYQDAYTACLSITILPTVLQRLTGLADAYIFKLIVPFIYALTAPVLFLSLRKYVDIRMAYLAGFIYVSFPTFITDMAMLNRQEIAFLCVALALFAGLDQALSRRQRLIFGFIFFSGMVMAHYSTSYVTLAMLLSYAGILTAYNLWRKFRHQQSLTTGLIVPPSVIAATLLVLIGWNTLATQTSGNLGQTFAKVIPNIPQIFTTRQILPQVGSNPQELVNKYQATVTASRPLPSDAYYPTSDRVTAQTEPISPLTNLGQQLHLPSHTVYRIFDALKQDYAKLIEVLLILGLGLVTFIKSTRQKLPVSYVLLGLAALFVIALQVILPADVINYGLLRLMQQSLLLLAFPIIAVVYWLLSKVRLPLTALPKVTGVILAGFFLILSGLLPAITGGYKAALPLSNSGFYYQAYYTHQNQVDADHWLQLNTPTGSRIYSDEFGRRQMITFSGLFPQPTLVPSVIPRDSYVFLSDSNTQFDNVPVYDGLNLIFYHVPYHFLDTNKNLIYSSGGVQIYR